MGNSLTASRANNPCPVCGRTKDTDCRWSDDVIMCHQGTSFAPPAHLNIGDTITINDRVWALVSRNGGFDGSAAVFKPHRPSQSPPHQLPTRHRPAAPDLSQQRQDSIELGLSTFLENYRVCWNVPDFHGMNSTEQREAFDLIENTALQGELLASNIQSVWRDFPMLKARFKDAFEMAVKTLKYLKKDVYDFRFDCLGELPQ